MTTFSNSRVSRPTVVVRAHLVHELVPAVREPGHGEAPLHSAEVLHRSGLLVAFARVHDVQTELAPQPGGLFLVQLIGGFRRLKGSVARVTQVNVGALVGGVAARTESFLHREFDGALTGRLG